MDIIGGIGNLARAGLGMYHDHKNFEWDLLKDTANFALDSVSKGLGIIGSGASAYNKWKHQRKKLESEAQLANFQTMKEKAKLLNDNPQLVQDIVIQQDAKKNGLSYAEWKVSGIPYQQWKQRKRGK